MSLNVVRFAVAAGLDASARSWVMAGPITQVPTNMPTAIAAIAAMQRLGPEVDACSRWRGKRMGVSE